MADGLKTYRVIISRGKKPDEVMTFTDVDGYGAAEQAIRDIKKFHPGWRKWGIKRVECRGWVTSLDYSPPRQNIVRPIGGSYKGD